jgi:YVTN family beta-propeller protein
LALGPEKKYAYLTLAGSELKPQEDLLVVDLAKRKIRHRIPVGRSPFGLALHPAGKHLLVANRFSNFLSIVDLYQQRVVGEIPVPFYCEDIVFGRDGKRAYVSNSWKDQVLVIDLTLEHQTLTGKLRDLGFGGQDFLGTPVQETLPESLCNNCGWRAESFSTCPRCNSDQVEHSAHQVSRPDPTSIRRILQGRCGTISCHQFRRGGFYAGPDPVRAFRSAAAHVSPGDPEASVLLRATTPFLKGGFEGLIDGRHHPGGVVFEHPDHDPDYQAISRWIRDGVSGPGIPAGNMPRDMVLSPDGSELFVANTGSLDISVLDLATLRETRRIWVQAPVNDLSFAGDRLLVATTGLGSGHPGKRDPKREAYSLTWVSTRDISKRWNRGESQADFSIYRDKKNHKLPTKFTQIDPTILWTKDPLGPFDHVDGTAQEGPRDITNDIVLLDPRTKNVAAYQANEHFTRYTSDTYEAMAGDQKGDVDPKLMKVVGAFPEQMLVHENHLYVAMSGTFEIQEWTIDLQAPPNLRLQPSRAFEVGVGPNDLALVDNTLLTVGLLQDSLTFLDLTTGDREDLFLEPGDRRYPATDYERGEMLVETSAFASDGDQSCVHCHYRNTNDGKRWSNMGTLGRGWRGQESFGGSREIPDLRGLTQKIPFLLEGVESPYELVPQLLQVMPIVGFQGVTPVGDFTDVHFQPGVSKPFPLASLNTVKPGEKLRVAPKEKLEDLLERRRLFLGRVSRKYFGHAIDFPEMVRLVGVFLEGQARMLPNPVPRNDPMVQEGKLLFEDPETACASCHPAPTFTDKETPQNQNKSFFPLISPAPRDNAVTLISSNYQDRIRYEKKIPPDQSQGRIEEHEGHYVSPSLRGMWSEPPIMLHHGHAVSLREVICTPGHIALRRFPFPRPDLDRPGGWEKGQNEMEGILDTHGATSHLNTWEIECLLAYLESIE